jgi:hypothetical protein
VVDFAAQADCGGVHFSRNSYRDDRSGKRNSDDVAFVDWTVRRISRLLDDGLIEIEFAYHGGVATNRSQSRWNTSVAAWKINPSLLR